jgi:hypothetical protein
MILSEADLLKAHNLTCALLRRLVTSDSVIERGELARALEHVTGHIVSYAGLNPDASRRSPFVATDAELRGRFADALAFGRAVLEWSERGGATRAQSLR